jgi:hypothetical protein
LKPSILFTRALFKLKHITFLWNILLTSAFELCHAVPKKNICSACVHIYPSSVVGFCVPLAELKY